MARLVREAVRRERLPMTQVINDALRRALRPPPTVPAEPCQLVPYESKLRPGVDLAGVNRLADELKD